MFMSVLAGVLVWGIRGVRSSGNGLLGLVGVDDVVGLSVAEVVA